VKQKGACFLECRHARGLSYRQCEERSDEAIHRSAWTIMDCFAEPVIGLAFAIPAGSQ
jgi:hypothetical protein